MEQAIIFEIPHIRLTLLDTGVYCLIVEDISLNDYVEDLLWDDYEYHSTTVSMPHRKAIPVYYNYFAGGVAIEGVLGVLRQLDVNEVERIFRLNN